MRLIVAAAAAILVFVILIQSGVLSALILFILMGAVPSTTFTIPPSSMLLIMATIGWLVLVQSTLSVVRTYRQSKLQHVASYQSSLANRRRPLQQTSDKYQKA